MEYTEAFMNGWNAHRLGIPLENQYNPYYPFKDSMHYSYHQWEQGWMMRFHMPDGFASKAKLDAME
jgi:hypothetical protein